MQATKHHLEIGKGAIPLVLVLVSMNGRARDHPGHRSLQLITHPLRGTEDDDSGTMSFIPNNFLN